MHRSRRVLLQPSFHVRVWRHAVRGLASLIRPEVSLSSGMAPYRFDRPDPNTVSQFVDHDSLPILACESEDEDIDCYNSKFFAREADTDDDTEGEDGSIDGDCMQEVGHDDGDIAHSPIILRPRPELRSKDEESPVHQDRLDAEEIGLDGSDAAEREYSYSETSEEDQSDASSTAGEKPVVMHVFSEVLAGISFPTSLQVRSAKFVHYPWRVER